MRELCQHKSLMPDRSKLASLPFFLQGHWERRHARVAESSSLKKGIRERCRDKLALLSVKAACLSERSLSDAHINAKLSARESEQLE